MQIINNLSDWKILPDAGLVMTMGNLHQGHGSLIKQSVAENPNTVLTIFINPTQFNNPNDLKNYPKTMDNDLELAQDLGVHTVLTLDYKTLYPDNYDYRLTETNFSKLLCGASRGGHFDGVLSIVLKHFNIIKPKRAYFGEKDYQQFYLIKKMCEALFLDIDIVGCPTIREPSGLAMSSRNNLLSDEEKQLASNIYKQLKSNQHLDIIKNNLIKLGFKIDYLEDYNNRRYLAVYLNDIRLIDNIVLGE